MSCKCKNKNKCGCRDKPLVTQIGCTPNPTCEEGDPCPETFAAQCAVYTGNSIVDLGIDSGERMDIIIQRLGLMVINPGCIIPDSGCQSALGVKTTNVGSGSAVIKWQAVDVATQYQVEYKLASVSTYTLSPVVPIVSGQTLYSDKIAGLTAGEEYHVRVNTTCSAGNCFSLVISFKTLNQ